MEIKWKKEYSVGIEEIDDQHKYFISLLNDLYNAIVEGKSQEELKVLFQDLSDYAEKHFAYRGCSALTLLKTAFDLLQ